MKRCYKNYSVKDNYFKTWTHDMAYILGFIVADGCLRPDGYYVKIEVAPKDVSVLEFVCSQITPDYELKTTQRGKEVRWYPSSKEMKNDLVSLGVVPNKTGKEVVPDSIPDQFLWDFIRGYFDGDGDVEDCCVRITCHSKNFLEQLCGKTGIGRINKDGVNYRWVTEKDNHLIEFKDNLYATGSFCLARKKKLIELLVDYKPSVVGRFSSIEDEKIISSHGRITRWEMAINLNRSPAAIKNRISKLRKRGVPFAV